MKIKKLFKNIIPVLFVSFALAACGEKQNEDVCGENIEYETPITESFKFANEGSIPNNNFLSATSGLAIMEVSLASNTDGDTSNFYPLNDETATSRFRFRYEGIDTPESTGAIQEWGLKASHFTKSKLTNASRIVVVNDLDLFEKYDSSGGRYMGFVWYQPNDGADFRLLNLEIVEQGYSLNLLNQNSQILDGYYEAFQEAQEAAKGRRVNGEKDCDFDSSGEVVETTISNAKENFDTLGVNDSTGNSGKQLRIIGQVIAISGSDFYVRDVNPSDEDVVPASIFAFTQYKSSGVKVGDIVRFYAKITKYYGNLQLTDVKLNNDHYPFEILATTKEEAEELGYVYNVDPVYMDPSLITSTDSFEPYAGNLVRTTITIEDSEDFVYQSQTDSSTFSIHATCNGIELNIRCEGHNFFSSESTIRTVFERGKSYDVNVLLGIFQYNDSEEVSYQIEFPFFKASEYKNYISEHIN